ncbi:Cytoplasmic and mitochondrial histidine tRNA synthetase [Diaporthe australafricana]|uniref:histidine--tRNA ligase n=1 Tax=Diaporthe australafricana TaxID=127596 RepID=A0ABR3Y4R0_9PEZI
MRPWYKQELTNSRNSQKLSDVFECHGGQELDTPALELRQVLTGKYGEDSGLIYDLADQGGEPSSLRYDLTVPFARWLAMNLTSAHVSRYSIGKVYRRDQPAVSRGRYREFYQCDFDIAGDYDPMIADSEVILVAVEAFEALGIDVTVKLNHRLILDGIFAVAGVPEDKIRSISSAVDKLDKVSWDDVRNKMMEKGLAEDVANQIGGFVLNSGDMSEILEFLKPSPSLMESSSIQSGVEEMSLLVSYLQAYDIVDKMSFDLSLARGLDYYTGLIFEVVAKSPDSKGGTRDKKHAIQVGSIAAGGRYDNLAGMYGNRKIPCVGISFGVERIYTILEARRPKNKNGPQPAPDLDVYVISAGAKDHGLLLERMAVLATLTRAGVRAAIMRRASPKLMPQFKAAKDVPLTVLLGPDELAMGMLRLKVCSKKGGVVEGENEEREAKDNRGYLVSKEELVDEVKRLLKRQEPYISDEAEKIDSIQ